MQIRFSGSALLIQDVSVPEDAKDFIRKILVLDPKKRPILDELLDHPFMQKKDEIKYLPVEA